MATKLTLRISPVLIKRAKVYAKQHKKSVSQMVGDYFLLLSYADDKHEPILSLPITQSLRGVLVDTSQDDYKNYLAKKYL